MANRVHSDPEVRRFCVSGCPTDNVEISFFIPIGYHADIPGTSFRPEQQDKQLSLSLNCKAKKGAALQVNISNSVPEAAYSFTIPIEV